MGFKKSALIFSILSTLLIPSFVFAELKPTSEGIPQLIFFHSPSCHKCIRLKNEFMPQIEGRFKGRITIDYRDLSDIENYKLLIGLKEHYASTKKNELPVVFFDGYLLSGEDQIKRDLLPLIYKTLSIPSRKFNAYIPADLVKYFLKFTPAMVISSGLIDGINPCAFTVIVFFISFLSLQGYRKKELIIIGLSFIWTVFLTYLLIGLGLFNFLYRLKRFWLIAKITNLSIGTFSLILGVLAICDFLKLKETGKTEGLILQLPQVIKNQIHAVIGAHYRKSGVLETGVASRHIFRLIISALVTGFLVSILEAVCTGQVYLPTITFVLKTSHIKLQALGYLLLYNLMFIIPLLLIFLLALLGVTSGEFSKTLRKHILTIKITMAILFISLGLFIIWTA